MGEQGPSEVLKRMPNRSCGIARSIVTTGRWWATRNLALPIGDRLMGHPMIQRLRFLERAQWWSPEEIVAKQNEYLASTVRTAYSDVPFYRSWLDAAGVRPEEIQSAADLVRIPVVTKPDLRAAYPDSCIRRTGQRAYEAATSGSTGQGFRIMEDNETAGWYRASFLLASEWAGWRVGEPHVQSGVTLERSGVKALKDRMLGCHYVSTADLRDERLDEVLDLLERRNVRHILGYPAFVYFLAIHAQKRGWNRTVASVITWGEMLLPPYRALIECVFGARVYDTYGCSEGFQISAQCEVGNGYHTHDLDVALEIVDDDGQPVQPNETGNVVITRLHPGPMPFIRYSVGDLATRGDATPCACGRGFSMMSAIQGRSTGVVITPSGNRLLVHFFNGILKTFPDVDHYQIIQTTAQDLTIRIVPRGVLQPGTTDAIVELLRERGVDDMRVLVESTPVLPLTPGGKRRYIINESLRDALPSAA